MDLLMENLGPLSHLLGYVIIGVAEVAASVWTWMALPFITFFRLWGFLGTKIMFIIEKSTSLSAARSVPSPFSFRKLGLESRTSDQQLDYGPRSLIRFPMHDKHFPSDECRGKERRSVEDTMRKCKGSITFSSDFIYNVECKKNCIGGSFFMNDSEEGRPLGPWLLDNCAGLLRWRRVVSFETQFGWDRLQSLSLGYGCSGCKGDSGLNFEKNSKYLVRDSHVAKVLDSPKRSIVKLFSLQEDAVSSIDMVWNMGLAFTSTTDNTVRLWDIEVGKCLNQMTGNDYAIVGSHIENNSGSLFNSIVIRDVEASLLVWDGRDFQRPLNFCVGNMSKFQSLQFNDNKVCVSDCFNERLFDLRKIGSSTSDHSSMRSKAMLFYE